MYQNNSFREVDYSWGRKSAIRKIRRRTRTASSVGRDSRDIYCNSSRASYMESHRPLRSSPVYYIIQRTVFPRAVTHKDAKSQITKALKLSSRATK